MKVVIIICISFMLTKAVLCRQWVDPHDMNTNIKSRLKHYEVTDDSLLKQPDSCATKSKSNCDICTTYIKHIISLLLQRNKEHDGDKNIYHGHFSIDLDKNEYDILMQFITTKGDVNLDTLRKVDAILTDRIHNNVDKYVDMIEALSMRIYAAVCNENIIYFSGVCLMLYVVYNLFKANFSLGYVVKYLLVLVLIVDYGIRYIQLKEEAEEHNFNLKYSSGCDTGKMSWSQYFLFLTSSRDCEQKVVTPLEVFLLQVKHLIIVPLHALGNGLGGFGKEMFVQLPWGLNIIMWPTMLVFACISMIFIMAITTGKRIKINVFHIFCLEFGGENNKNRITGDTVDKLLNAFQRPMIEEVKPRQESSHIEKKKDQSVAEGEDTREIDQKNVRENEEINRRIEVLNENKLENTNSSKLDLNMEDKLNHYNQ